MPMRLVEMRLRFPIYFIGLLGVLGSAAGTLQGCALINAANDYFDERDAYWEDAPPQTHSRRSAYYDWSPEEEARSEELWRIREAKRRRDLVLGMGTSDVESIWGSPRSIETAGDSNSGNERWVYSNSIFGANSLTPQRVVFFENGRVVGWSTGSR